MVLNRRSAGNASSCTDPHYGHDVRNPPSKSNLYYSDPEINNANGINGLETSRIGYYFGRLIIFIEFLALGFISYYAFTAKSELKRTTNELSSLGEEYKAIYQDLSNTDAELSRSEALLSLMNKKMQSMNLAANRRDNGASTEHHYDLVDSILLRHETQGQRIKEMQRHIQHYHMHTLEETYGPGPYQIEVAVLIEGVERLFTIETAPNELLPHTIHYFMSMVEANTYDHTILYNGDHIILATLEASDEKHQVSDLAEKRLFPEYAEQFPHVQNTVGFVRRSGGPQFYINTDDNTSIHGPGGQKDAFADEADPCFGKVVRGLDVLSAMMDHSHSTILRMTVLRSPKNGTK